MVAIRSEVFGSFVGEIFESVELKNARGVLWAEIYEVYFGRKSGSISGVVVGDGARNWKGLRLVWGS